MSDILPLRESVESAREQEGNMGENKVVNSLSEIKMSTVVKQKKRTQVTQVATSKSLQKLAKAHKLHMG